MGCSHSKKDSVQPHDTFAEIARDYKCSEIVWHDSIEVPAAVSTMRGRRNTQEDAAVAISHSEKKFDALLCGVFDGHSGGGSSSFVSMNVFPNIIQTSEWRDRNIKKALIEGFLLTDTDLRKSNITDGTTAVCSIITRDKIFVGNCGDSRAILCRSGSPVPLSTDHKPYVPIEVERIERAGGYIEFQNSSCPRVMAPDCYFAMATSRSFGDFHFKSNPSKSQLEQIVTACPTVVEIDRTESDQFVILASDGVWDVMSNEEVCTFLINESAKFASPTSSSLCSSDREHPPLTQPQPPVAESSRRLVSLFKKSKRLEFEAGHLAEALLSHCFAIGTKDNCAVVIIDLRKQG